MSSSEEETFEGGGAGASLTEPIRAGEVKKGMTVMLKGKPCKVSTESPHGASEITFILPCTAYPRQVSYELKTC